MRSPNPAVFPACPAFAACASSRTPLAAAYEAPPGGLSVQQLDRWWTVFDDAREMIRIQMVCAPAPRPIYINCD
jgi:hypothetical protein